MHLSPNIIKRRLYKVAVAFFAAILIFCSLGAGQQIAAAEEPNTFKVTNSADSSAGSMRQAILDANALPSGSDFKIVIQVEGTLVTLSALPVLQIDGRSGWIQSNPNATITGFSCEIRNGGHFTLQNATIDNSAYDLVAVFVTDYSSENTLLLNRSNRIIGSVPGYDKNIGLNGALTIDKVPGGSDMDSTLILTDTDIEIRGLGQLRVKGGTIESHGVVDGIDAYRGVVVEGGKLIATGGFLGIETDLSDVVINGGTVVARGDPYEYDIVAHGYIFNGGSVDARAFYDTHPRDRNRNRVYLVTVTVGDPAVKNTEVSCNVNGGASFTSITDTEGKLYLWMPEGNGAAEVNAGGMVYHVSGPVAANYDNVMPPPVVTGVVVTPSYTTALTGVTVQYSARVEGLYDPPQTVTWTVENARADTTIDGSGLLTISPRETSTNLLVTAASTYDPSKSGAAQVAVLSVIGIIIGAVFLFLLLVLLAVFLEVRARFLRR